MSGPPAKEMNMEAITKPRPIRPPLNGVDTPSLVGALNLLTEQNALAKFQFRATNKWHQGTHSRTSIESFSGAGGEHHHEREFVYEIDHPQILVGRDHGPTPVEFLLTGL